jgi:hypothetical protein
MRRRKEEKKSDRLKLWRRRRRSYNLSEERESQRPKAMRLNTPHADAR